MMPATKKAAKAAPKKKAGQKTTGDVEGDDFLANVSPAQPVDDRSYNINMADGWIRVQYSEGLVDYIMVEFHVN